MVKGCLWLKRLILRDFISWKECDGKICPQTSWQGRASSPKYFRFRFRRYFRLIESVSSFCVLGQSTTSETDSISWYHKAHLSQCALPRFLLFLITILLSAETRSCILTWNFCPSCVFFPSMPTGVRVSKAWEVSAPLSSLNADYCLQVTCRFYFAQVFFWLSFPQITTNADVFGPLLTL